MSTVTRTQAPRYPCAHPDCDADRTAHSSVAGSYCSERCAALDTGASFLRAVRQDHRFCWSCFRQRKEIERPSDAARRGRGRYTAEAMVGFEFPTKHVEVGPHGLECHCGAIDHDTPEWDQRRCGPYHWFLYLVAEEMVAEGQRETSLDLVTFAEELWQTDNLALALGRAFRAADDPAHGEAQTRFRE